MSEFENVPTEQLRRETLERANEVHSINDAAWDAVGPCFLGACGAMALTVFGGVMIGLEIWPIGIASFVAAPFIFWRFYMPWRRAIRTCDAFSKEMRQRRAALMARKVDGHFVR